MNILLKKYRRTTFFGILGFIFGSLASLFFNFDIYEYYIMWSNNGQGYIKKEDIAKLKSDQENAVKTKNAFTLNKMLIPFFGIIALTTISTIMTTKYAEKYIIEIGFNSNDLGTIMMVTALSGVVAKETKSYFERFPKLS